MPAPYAIARANRSLFNPLIRRFAGKVPPLVLVAHRGRTSGRRYRTPIFGFFEGEAAIVVALTYGPDVDWLRNLRAAAGGEIVARGRTIPVGAPVVQTGLDQTTAIPAIVRPVLRLLRVSQFARLPLRAAAPGRS